MVSAGGGAGGTPAPPPGHAPPHPRPLLEAPLPRVHVRADERDGAPEAGGEPDPRPQRPAGRHRHFYLLQREPVVEQAAEADAQLAVIYRRERALRRHAEGEEQGAPEGADEDGEAPGLRVLGGSRHDNLLEVAIRPPSPASIGGPPRCG